MGRIKKLLFSKKIKETSDIYKDFISLEICENFHIHIRNFRMIFNNSEFMLLCQSIFEAYRKWSLLGFPNPTPLKDETLTPPTYLFNGKISPIHGERSRDFQIEIQDSPWMPNSPEFIHFHYRSLRLDMSHEEFVELAEGFSEALEEFKKWKTVKELMKGGDN